ncbi:hypothetical protein LB565_29300 [Mesorhizobium sp. CA14]|uniref:DUF6527 family protein n=1 Tax=Mesorhizobium sp. CA14 TaxID=2876642 RepID=UPI001CCF48C5|nr:DUF6527 family protein [Mesorhizobium sp. CA14]MBZ9852078.1 hypothetical protein [Mesorhizobium sp. CA14]
MLRKSYAVQFKGTVERQSEAISLVERPGDVVLVERGVPRAFVMKCPDGCGDVLTVNLDSRAGPAWRFYQREDGLTLFPSVWRDTGCGAHFIVWDDTIHWTNDSWALRRDPSLEAAVEACLTDELVSFVDIAAALDEVPWSVLDACRSLVDGGRAIEGAEPNRASFRLARA